jgi:hypothetical protein
MRKRAHNNGNTDQIIRPSERVKFADIGISMHFLGDIKLTFIRRSYGSPNPFWCN